ncbi:site-specific DNA-methyltransferase [Methylobacterium nigriterrae]|uniref:site-specific DNA-methyltransferase n=1 Tax=Methylobacterium nigriterrae TaxID=3127512 RepID=UPI0030134EEC
MAYCPLDSLRSYQRNARTHSERQIEQIAESIRAFGFISPIVADETGEIIAGHGRLAAARLLGSSQVPVVRIEHLSDAQKRALRLADNRLAELAGWDETLLALEFKDLLAVELTLDIDFDLAVTGFSAPQVDRLVEAASAPTSRDDVLPNESETLPRVSQLGDLWALGEHRILCGDAQDRASYEQLLGPERATMAIHDFPYDLKISGHVAKRGRHREFVMGSGEMGERFTPFLAGCLTHTAAVLRPGGLVYGFMDWRHMTELATAGREAGLELKNLCVWDKGTGAMGSLYRSQHELVFLFKEPSGAHVNNVQLGRFGRNRTNLWSCPGAPSLRRELELHPTPKPVILIAEAIRDASNRNDIVLDAFSGSGTTIIAAAKTGRRARVLELDPAYVDVAIRRWESWAGDRAVHLATGLSFEALAADRQGGSGAPPPPARSTELSVPMRSRQTGRRAAATVSETAQIALPRQS